MRASTKDNVRGRTHQEKDNLEEAFDENILESDTEAKGIVDNVNMKATKTFKHLRKDNEIEF